VNVLFGLPQWYNEGIQSLRIHTMLTKSLAVMIHMFSGEGAIVKRIQQTQQRRADYWLLRNMSDKSLRDVGITRGEIYSKVYPEQKAKA